MAREHLDDLVAFLAIVRERKLHESRRQAGRFGSPP